MAEVRDDPKHASLRRQLTSVLQALGHELMPEDQAVADLFLRLDRHVSVEELCRLLRDRGGDVDSTHVRRTMRFLAELGLARRIDLDDHVVYEHLHPDEHHDHLICMRCGAIEEFVSEQLEDEQVLACRQRGFQPLMHTLIIRGICQACSNRIPPTRSLASCLGGETVQVVEIVGGTDIRHRLLDLGLVRNAIVKVLRNDGPVAIDVKGSRIALGRGEAMKIITRRLQQA